MLDMLRMSTALHLHPNVLSLAVKSACLAEQVLFKMDKAGDCEEICMANIARNRELSFVGFTPEMFLEVANGLVLMSLTDSNLSSDAK